MSQKASKYDYDISLLRLQINIQYLQNKSIFTQNHNNQSLLLILGILYL